MGVGSHVLSEYISRRSPIVCRRGMAASSQPLASEAGLRILRAGGTAADAAVAMAAALNVCEPCSTGLGGDAFVLWYDAQRKVVESIQGNGRSPAGLTMDLVKERGHRVSLPPFDALTVSVPGAAAAWVDTVEKYGRLPMAQVLAPATELAEEGWPLPPLTAAAWARGVGQLKQGGPHGVDLLYKGERAPRPGEVMHNPHLANTFKLIAAHGKKGYYEGPIAEAIVEAVQSKGGVLTLEDLARHVSSFEKPISSTYRGIRVWEVPPPTQGIAALLALNVLEAFGDVGKMAYGSPEHLHVAVEAMRLAFADSLTHVADPVHHSGPVERLLSKPYAESRAKGIDPRAAARVAAGAAPPGGGSDTVYFCAVDGEGNACSMINSNYMGFGTGIVPKGCGFSLQNRAHNFSLDPTHANCLGPNRRPYHTIIPGLATWEPSNAPAGASGEEAAELYCAFGVMGGFMQPQGHMQVISNMVDFGMDPQAALDAPRFCIAGLPSLEEGHGPAPVARSRLYLEEGGEGRAAAARELQRMGHAVELVGGEEREVFGRGQIIRRDPRTGVLWGGSEGRADGCAMGY